MSEQEPQCWELAGWGGGGAPGPTGVAGFEASWVSWSNQVLALGCFRTSTRISGLA